MQEVSPLKKRGFTLIELLTVVTIIGVLSAAGVVSFRNAVINNKTRDAAVNMAAFAERVDAKARQYNDSLCITASGNLLKAVRFKIDENATTCEGDVVDSLKLESIFTIATPPISITGFTGTAIDWGTDADVHVVPRIGLSAFQTEGYFVARYGGESSDRYAAAVKTQSNNRFIAMMSKNGGSSWERL